MKSAAVRQISDCASDGHAAIMWLILENILSKSVWLTCAKLLFFVVNYNIHICMLLPTKFGRMPMWVGRVAGYNNPPNKSGRKVCVWPECGPEVKAQILNLGIQDI